MPSSRFRNRNTLDNEVVTEVRMEAVVQSEAAECGLACLATIASTHGNRIGLRELRRRHPLSLKGASLAQIIGIADKMHLAGRPLRLEHENHSELQLPCILHWDLNHFVVLARVEKRGLTILDPAFGKRTMQVGEFSRHFTGVALELTPSNEFVQAAPAPAISLSQLTGRITGLWRAIALILVLSLVLQVFVLIAPFFMQCIVDHVLIAADRDLLTVLGVGFLLALLLQVAISLLRGRAVTCNPPSLAVAKNGTMRPAPIFALA